MLKITASHQLKTTKISYFDQSICLTSLLYIYIIFNDLIYTCLIYIYILIYISNLNLSNFYSILYAIYIFIYIYIIYIYICNNLICFFICRCHQIQTQQRDIWDSVIFWFLQTAHSKKHAPVPFFAVKAWNIFVSWFKCNKISAFRFYSKFRFQQYITCWGYF